MIRHVRPLPGLEKLLNALSRSGRWRKLFLWISPHEEKSSETTMLVNSTLTAAWTNFRELRPSTWMRNLHAIGTNKWLERARIICPAIYILHQRDMQ